MDFKIPEESHECRYSGDTVYQNRINEDILGSINSLSATYVDMIDDGAKVL
jgi:hypothetical protein